MATGSRPARAWKPLAVLAVLAGCLGPPPIPEDAVTDEDGALPGLELSAWTLMHGQRLRMHGVLENGGDRSYDIRVGCGQPWNSTIVDEDGATVEFREVLEESNCAVLWDVLRPKAHMDILYSWDFRDHDVEADRHTPVAPGNYTWILQFTLRGQPEYLETRIPIQVG